jgi:hypothetical protein
MIIWLLQISDHSSSAPVSCNTQQLSVLTNPSWYMYMMVIYSSIYRNIFNLTNASYNTDYKPDMFISNF